jgi:RNA polymerase sigma factor (sigma-70 family)
MHEQITPNTEKIIHVPTDTELRLKHDPELLNRELEAIRPIVLRFLINNYFSNSFNPRVDAEDALQGAFVNASRFIGQYDAKSSFRTWVMNIAINKAKEVHRSYESRRFPDRNRKNTRTINDPEYEDNLKDLNPTPEDNVYAAEISKAVQTLIHDKLENKPTQKQIVALHMHENMGPAEIAQKLNLELSMVKSILFRFNRTLKEYLESQGFGIIKNKK